VATSRIAESVGRVLGGRYRLTRPVGTGASAHVFEAEDVRLRRKVAVKVLDPLLATEPAFLRRFEAEARFAASLQHAHIVRVYDWGQDGETPYIVTELLEGGSLKSLLGGGARLTLSQATALGVDVAAALDYAHREGLVHRDVKPANLLFDREGRVAVADFGLARAIAEAAWTEPTGTMIGTARYASPEQVRGERLDARADVYALALVLVEAVTGEVPFALDTAYGTLMARTSKPMPIPAEMGPLKPALEAAGRLDAAERSDMAGFASALRRAGASLPPPGPFPLVRLVHLDTGGPNDLDPTEFPGRPRLFDGEAAGWHAPQVVAPSPPAPRTGTAGWQSPPPADRPAEPAAAAGPAVVAAPSGPAVGGAESPAEAGAGGDEPRRRRWPRRLLFAVLALLLLAGAGGGAYALVLDRKPPLRPVPSLVGQTQAAATATLQTLHLRLAVTGGAYSSRYGAGRVISQTPSVGRVRQGSVIDVVVSQGPQPVAVPTLATDSVTEAEQILTSLGLKYTVTQPTSMSVPAGIVISSTPDSGTLVPGQSVALVVSAGKPQVAVPTLAGAQAASFQAASAALSSVGLSATESDQYSDSIPAGHVIGTDPAPGQKVDVGTQVTVQISKGPHLVAVPNVDSMSVGAAAQQLQAAGLSVSGVTGNPLGTVVRTQPAAGTQVRYGSAVQLYTG
jgi:beta-lactam-binding protein with PASTA domain